MLLGRLTSRAMGTRACVMVLGADRDSVGVLLRKARERVEVLEGRWSRFRSDSEISRLNDLAGRPVIVSPETCDLISRALEGWRFTGGHFDPCLLAPLRDLGYDRDFAAVRESSRIGAGEARAGDVPSRSVGLAGDVVVDPVLNAVTLPSGGGFDPGGIGKGYAADVVAHELSAAGADAVLVNLGGDQRAGGLPPAGGWRVRVENPLDPDGAPLGSLRLVHGGIATTTSCRRRWIQGDVVHHHVLDPRTGLPADTDLAGVTVVASEAWQAEVFAKAAFLAGSRQGRSLLEQHGVSGLLVGHDATVVEVGLRTGA